MAEVLYNIAGAARAAGHDLRQPRRVRAAVHLERPAGLHGGARRRLDSALLRRQPGGGGHHHPGLPHRRAHRVAGDGLRGRLHPHPYPGALEIPSQAEVDAFLPPTISPARSIRATHQPRHPGFAGFLLRGAPLHHQALLTPWPRSRPPIAIGWRSPVATAAGLLRCDGRRARRKFGILALGSASTAPWPMRDGRVPGAAARAADQAARLPSVPVAEACAACQGLTELVVLERASRRAAAASSPSRGARRVPHDPMDSPLRPVW
jgi:hypothetical protein